MRFEGKLTSWNEERGFGFIAPTMGGEDIFVHLTSIPTRLRPPKPGQLFNFEVELNREGKKRAANLGVVQITRTGPPPRRHRSATWSMASTLAIPVFGAVYVAVAATWRVSTWVAFAYLVLSVVCILAYAIDKSAAVSGRRRSSEKSLLFLGVAGGWPGAILAQQFLRHKSSKVSFRRAFWGTVLVNVTGFVLFHSPLILSLRN